MVPLFDFEQSLNIQRFLYSLFKVSLLKVMTENQKDVKERRGQRMVVIR